VAVSGAAYHGRAQEPSAGLDSDSVDRDKRKTKGGTGKEVREEKNEGKIERKIKERVK
jgi:hypothetical protein